MEGSESSHRKLSSNKSDSLVIVNNDRHHESRRKKSVVARVSSLPGETSRLQHLNTGSNLKRSRSSRRSHRSSSRGNPRTASTSSDYNGGAFSTPGMARAEQLLLQNSTSLHPHQSHLLQGQLEIGEPLTNYSGASITSLKLSTPPSYNHANNRQSFRAKPRKPPMYGNRGRRASAWSGEQMRGDFAEIVHKIVNHPQSIVSFSVILVVVGVLLIVIALSSSSNLLNYIGIGFIILGVLIFVIGAAWFYSHSKDIVRQQAKLNERANLRLISLQALEEEKPEDDEQASDTPAEV